MEKYRVVDASKCGDKARVLSTHHSYVGGKAVLDQLRSWKPNGNFAIIQV